MYDQLCNWLCFNRENTDCRMLTKSVYDNAQILACIDTKKAFDSPEAQYVPNDTVTDPTYEMGSNFGYKTQGQTNIPCYSYCGSPCQVNYVYGASDCLGLLVLQCCDSDLHLTLNLNLTF